MRVGNLSNRLYANENPPHYIPEVKTIAYDVTYLIYSCPKKGSNRSRLYSFKAFVCLFLFGVFEVVRSCVHEYLYPIKSAIVK